MNKMSFNHEKILNVLKTSLYKIASKEVLLKIIRKDLSLYIQKVALLRNSNGIIQNFKFSKAVIKSVQLKEDEEAVEDSRISQKIADNVLNIETSSPLQWKTEISKPIIISQTQHILESIQEAQTNSSFQARVGAFISFIHKVPGARIISVKEGAIRILLNARERFKDKDLAAVREALALLGYTDPVPGKGIRVLSIDGGGIRGLLVLEMLKKLEELTGKRIYELFDLICGTSTGAILSFSMGIYHKSMDEIAEGYLQISNEVFKQSPLWGTGNLVWTQSYYSTPLWEKNLKKYLGDFRLSETARDPLCPKLCAVSAVVNQSNLSAYIFRNYSLPWKVHSQYLGSSNHMVWEAARASAAAPTYFEEFKLGDFIHQDGGIIANNPTAIAIHEAKLLWPNHPIQCVVSFGTGRTIPYNNYKNKNQSIDPSVNTTWKNKFLKIVDSATDTEGIHTILSDLLPENVYYRFNPYLTEMISMVEIDEKKLEQMKRDALMYLRRNEDKFHGAAKALSEPKSYFQKKLDWMKVKRHSYEF